MLLVLPGTATTALAQDLTALLKQGRTHAVSARVSQAQLESTATSERVERAGLWPTLTVKGGYTFNQVESGFTQGIGNTGETREIVITPQNQVEGSVRVTVPVLDLGRWRRIDVLRERVGSERTSALAAQLTTDEAVVQAYHDGLVALYVTKSAETRAATAADRLALALKRLEAGVAADLDVARARAEVERAKGVIAEGQLGVARARRKLLTLTGASVTFDDQSAPFASDGPFDGAAATARLEGLPRVKRAREDEAIARKQADDALMALVPRVDVFAEERFTNGAGFGEAASFLAGIQATVTLDMKPFRDQDERAASAELAARRAEEALEVAEDALRDLVDQITSLRIQLEAATAELGAATVAADVAQRRFRDGGGTQLDAITADRERFDAEVAVAKARCSLGLAEALVRLAAGLDLAEGGP